MSPFTVASLAGLAALVLAASRRGGRPFASFVGVIFGVHTLASCALARHVPAWAMPAFAFGQAALFVHVLSYARGTMPSVPWRLLVSWPGSVFAAGTFLAIPWAVAGSFVREPPGLWVPYALAFLGFLDSFVLRTADVHVTLGGDAVPTLRRLPASPGAPAPALRVVQITDPHLGSFMSERRLRGVCERAVAAAPDLVLLTGDFLTVESHGAGDMLGRALAPLRALEGRTFACMGNHDHEAPEAVARALASAGVRLLVDAMATVELPSGPVEVLGYDFHWRDRAAHLAAVSARHPRTPGVPRLALLHDPGAFRLLPDGSADLVLSGHTHGGQIGLQRLGLAPTVVSALTSIPDHGLWGLGAMRLYVHRGTGHYGFPVRVGVGPEESVLHVHLAR